jgi:creatinine amidohydrolase/Fe(II)-dependent formamide hydrolase-like protein
LPGWRATNSASSGGRPLSLPLYWGINQITSDFIGSFRTRPEVARELLIDVGTSLAHDGFTTLYVINHQNNPKHAEVVLNALTHLRLRAVIKARWLADDEVIERFHDFADQDSWLRFTVSVQDMPRPSRVLGVHAHDIETAIMLR